MRHLEHVDVLIVGSGPAGSAAALAALQRRPDARVVILDRAPLGRDKVCGDGIAPQAIAGLAALGVDAVVPSELVPAVRLSIAGGGGTAAVTADPGAVVPRTVFDERLARAAIGAGAEFVQERVTSLVQDGDGVEVDGRWRAGVVIGADGAHSRVRRLTGTPGNRGRSLAIAVRGYAPTPTARPHELLIRLDARRGGGLSYAWAFPLHDGTTNVGYGLSSDASGGGRDALTRRLRELLPEYDLTGVQLTGHPLPLSTWTPRAAIGRVLLVGDAASLINPLTGEGIYSAIVSGALAGAAAADEAATASTRYRRALARRYGRQHRQLRLLMPLTGVPAVLDAVVRAGADEPALFNRLLDVGLGEGVFRLRDAAALLARIDPLRSALRP